jgi:hypothetical protein
MPDPMLLNHSGTDTPNTRLFLRGSGVTCDTGRVTDAVLETSVVSSGSPLGMPELGDAFIVRVLECRRRNDKGGEWKICHQNTQRPTAVTAALSQRPSWWQSVVPVERFGMCSMPSSTVW